MHAPPRFSALGPWVHTQVYDLLDLTNDVLAVKWDAKAKTFVVSDLLPVECPSFDDVITVVAEGYKNRRIGSMALNKESSWSHRWVVGPCNHCIVVQLPVRFQWGLSPPP